MNVYIAHLNVRVVMETHPHSCMHKSALVCSSPMHIVNTAAIHDFKVNKLKARVSDLQSYAPRRNTSNKFKPRSLDRGFQIES